MEEVRVDEPNVNDVLCGRGGSINSHLGNEHFRELVEKRKRVYLTARFKREKRLIASSIVSEIRELDPQGRFLTRKGGKDHGYWYDIGDEKARDKTSQALRENAPSIRAEIETEINQQRQELKQQGQEKDLNTSTPPPIPVAVASSSSSYPPPPPPHAFYNPRAYWDYYYYYYGYPPPTPPGHPPAAGAPYPPPAHQHQHQYAPILPPPGAPGAPPPPPPAGFSWGSPQAPGEFKEGPAAAASMPPPAPQHDAHAAALSQEQHDHQMASMLQHQEKEAVFEDRNRWLKSDPAAKLRQSTAFVSPGHRPYMQNDARHVPPPVAAPSFDHTVKTDHEMSQQEIDHRLAVALQEEEDNAVSYQIEHTSRRASRSSAFPIHGGSNNLCRNNISWVNQGNAHANTPNSPAASSNASAFEQILPTSFVQWTKGFANHPTSQEKGKPTAKNVHFGDRNSTYSPIQFEQNQESAPLMSQAAGHMLDTSLGSWDNSNTGGMMESSGSSFRVRVQQVTSPAAARKHPPSVQSSPRLRVQTLESTEGHEIELMDVRDECGMPPPEPRFSRTGGGGGGYMSDNMSGTNFLGGSGGSSHRRLNHAINGISPSHSLDMDESGNSNLSGNGSLGGGSLCNIFAEKDATPDEIIHRVLQQVPSWERSMERSRERSMRSRSPLSMSDLNEEGDSMIRVRQSSVEKPFAPPMTPIKDDPNEMDAGMDWE